MPDYFHNNISNEALRKEEENYNKNFIKSLQLNFDIDQYEGVIKDNDKSDSSPYMTVWLRNIDRLMKMVSKEINLKNYHFVDIGCGIGISSIYFFKKHKMKSYNGFDFNKNLIDKSKQIAAFLELDKKINFEYNSALKKKLDSKPYILFMFNPFGIKTLQKFINNNLNTLKKHNSVILYANDLWINDLKGYEIIDRNNNFNLSVIYF